MEVVKTISPADRWELGIDHDERSLELFDFISSYDWKFNGGKLDLESGGDGDNGEELLYLLDEYYAAVDLEKEGGSGNGSRRKE